MSGFVIPNDWDESSWQSYVVDWPSSEDFLSLLAGQLTTFSFPKVWDAETGDPAQAAAWGKEIENRNSASGLLPPIGGSVGLIGTKVLKLAKLGNYSTLNLPPGVYTSFAVTAAWQATTPYLWSSWSTHLYLTSNSVQNFTFRLIDEFGGVTLGETIETFPVFNGYTKVGGLSVFSPLSGGFSTRKHILQINPGTQAASLGYDVSASLWNSVTLNFYDDASSLEVF